MTDESLVRRDELQANEVQRLQKSVRSTAEESPLPARFIATPVAGEPRMDILDITTGRSYPVPLFAYRIDRDLLMGLFGEDGSATGE
jgi:hypothetical protein